MDFELSADQEALRDGVRKLCQGRFPMETVRAGVDRPLWRELAEAGVFTLRLPEADGGVGLGMAEGVLVFEELGRALVPGPLLATHLAAGLVDNAATGERLVGMVERGSGAVPALVEHLDVLDALVVVDDGGLTVVDPSGLDATPVVRPLDPLTPVHAVNALPAGDRIGDESAAQQWRMDGAALAAAFQLGIAGQLTDLAVAYAKERRQFDRPIGSFQAVKHLLADMLVRTEVARAAVYAAGVTLDDPAVGDPRRAVTVAKLLAGEAATVNGKVCVQVHGGMGFTWEVDVHLYLKRAWVLDTVLGGLDDQAEAMSAYV